MGTSWIIEGTVDPRWPINTRGNVGEVFPEVLTPLSYRLGVIAAEKAWRDAYAELGVTQASDFSGDDPVIIGLYGGYAYLNLSYLRILGVRAPGYSAERSTSRSSARATLRPTNPARVTAACCRPCESCGRSLVP